MSNVLRAPDGLLRWNTFEIPVAFSLEISRLGDVKLVFDLLQYAPGVSWFRDFEILSKLQRGDNRAIPFFHLSGLTEDGVSIVTDLARLETLQEDIRSSGAVLEFTGTAAEVILNFDVPHAGSVSLPTSVAYLSQGQLGFWCPSVQTPLGLLSASGASKLTDSEGTFGVVRIERTGTEAVESWLESCDELASDTLRLLSLAQGQWLQWTAREVCAGEILLTKTIRPHKARDHSGLASLFHFLHLEPVLRLVATSHAQKRQVETGVDVALSWMLSSASSIEGRYLNLMVALEHLVSVFCKKVAQATEVDVFTGEARAMLLQALDSFIEGRSLSGGEASTLKALRNALGSLNRPSFYEQITRLIKHYDVPVADILPELKTALVTCRNDLVHRGCFHKIGDDETVIYRNFDVAEEFLKRTVMAMLGYRGSYSSGLYDLELYHFGDGEVYPLKKPGGSSPTPESDVTAG